MWILVLLLCLSSFFVSASSKMPDQFDVSVTSKIIGTEIIYTITNNEDFDVLINSDFTNVDEATSVVVVETETGKRLSDVLEYVGQPPRNLIVVPEKGRIQDNISLGSRFPDMRNEDKGYLVFWSFVLFLANNEGEYYSKRYNGMSEIYSPEYSDQEPSLQRHKIQYHLYLENRKLNK